MTIYIATSWLACFMAFHGFQLLGSLQKSFVSELRTLDMSQDVPESQVNGDKKHVLDQWC